MATGSGRPVDFASGNHYAVLGIPRGASDADINRAYRNLARQYHPDKNNDKEGAELSFKRIAEAYSVLKDPEKRRQYDVTGGTQSYVSYEEAEQLWRNFCSTGNEDDQEGVPAAIPRDQDMRRKSMGLLLIFLMVFSAPRVMMQMLPGLAAAVIAIALFTRRESASKWAWCALALMIAYHVAPWSLRLRSGLSARPLFGAQVPQQGGGDSFLPVGIPHSGEEVMLPDGAFVRSADPRTRGDPDGAVQEGWQQRLLGDMTMSIKQGKEQVVMVFSRQGCPWCDRQLPVLQRAIQRRSSSNVVAGDSKADANAGSANAGGASKGAADAGGVDAGAAKAVAAVPSVEGAPAEAASQAAPAEAAPAAKAAAPSKEATSGDPAKSTASTGQAAPAPAMVVPNSGPGPNANASPPPLLRAPLRVFVFDAEEFLQFAQTFQVEAFPTTIAWGSPGVTPMAAQGYLDDNQMEQLLTTVAMATPSNDA